MTSRAPAEHSAVTRVSRIGRLAKRAQELHTADRHAADAARILAVAQSEFAQAVVDTAPLLSAEQVSRCRAVFAALDTTAAIEGAA